MTDETDNNGFCEDRVPEISELTDKQKEATAHNPKYGNLYVTGPPGSGKTVILLQRGMYLKNRDVSVLVLVYNRTLKKYITELKGYERMDVDTWHHWIWQRYDRYPPQYAPFDYKWDEILRNEKNSNVEYDVIMVDEGQDLPLDLYNMLRKLCKHMTIFADFNQKISNKENGNSDVETGIKNILNAEDKKIKCVELFENFRNTESIHNFAEKYLVINREAKTECKNPVIGDKPVIDFSLSKKQQLERIATHIENNPKEKIGIFCWNISEVNKIHLELNQFIAKEFKIQKYHNKLSWKEKNSLSFLYAGAYILTYQSAKGLRFDTVFLVNFNKDNVPDIYDELLKQQMYVAVSRAKSLLNIFSSEPVPEILNTMKDEKELRNIGGNVQPSGWEELEGEEEFLF